MTSAKTGTGVTLSAEINAVMTPLAEIRKIGFNETTEMIEVTNLGSGGVKEFIPGDRSIGVIKCGVYFINDSAQEALRTAQLTKALVDFELEFSGAGLTGDTKCAFSGYVKERGVDVAPGDPLMLQLDIQVTGDWVWS